jgi:hypothetical protein
MQPPQPPKSDNDSRPFTNLQNTVSSFANQMNNFATNIQDYVTNTVSGVINQTIGDQPQQSTTTSNNPNSGTSFNFGTTFDGPFNYTFSSPGNSAHTTTGTNNATASSQQQQRRRPSPAAATASSASVD